jgi:hypothetical protein
MYSKEQIVSELKRIAEKLNTSTLEIKDFEMNSTIPMQTLRYYMGSWDQALKDAGLIPKEDIEPSEEELLQDLIRLHQEFGETPSMALIKSNGHYENRFYKKKWKSINEAFSIARKRFADNSEDDEDKMILDPDLDDLIGNSDENNAFENDTDDPQNPMDMENDENEETSEDLNVDNAMKTDFNDENEDTIYTIAISDRKEEDFDKKMELELDKQFGLDEANPEDSGPLEIEDPIDLEPETINPVISEQNDEDIPVLLEKENNKSEPFIVSDLAEISSQKENSADILSISGEIAMKRKIRKIVGEPIDFRGMRFAPVNASGVMILFAMICYELGYMIEFVNQDFPSAEAKHCFDRENDQWEHVRIGFFYKTSELDTAHHLAEALDAIVCWKNDSLNELNAEVLELKTIISSLDRK